MSAVRIPEARTETTTDTATPKRRTLAMKVAAVAVAIAAAGSACAPMGGTAKGNQIAQIAMSKRGAGYVYGATGPYVFDCSGFTQWVYRQAGILIPRDTYGQAGGRRVSGAQPGDIVFMGPGHVGIYEGGNMMVDAGNPGTGVSYRPMYMVPTEIVRWY